MRMHAAMALYAGGPGSGPTAPCPQCGPKGGHSAVISRMREFDTKEQLSERVIDASEITQMWKEAGINTDSASIRALERHFGGGIPADYKVMRSHLVGAQGVIDGLKELEAKGAAEKDLANWIKQNMAFRVAAVPEAPHGLMATDSVGAGGERVPKGIVLNAFANPDELDMLIEDAGKQYLPSLPMAQAMAVYQKTGSRVEALYELYRTSLLHEAGHVLDFRTSTRLPVKGDYFGNLSDLLAHRVFGMSDRYTPAQLKDMLRSISGYAAASPQESVAEMFLSKQLGLPVPAELDVLPQGAAA